MKRLLSLLVCVVLGLTFFVSCSNQNTNDDDDNESYSISYYGVLDGVKIDLPAVAYLDNVTYPQEYVKGEITQINILKRYYNEIKDGKNYEISFEGWFYDQACTNEFSFISKSDTGDITIYAKLTSREIRTKRNIIYKAVIDNQIVDIPVDMYDDNVQYPTSYYEGDIVVINDLIKQYQPNAYSLYEFVKWYTTSECDQEFTSITATTTGDITIYAKINYEFWSPNA